jgi:exopolysaccharide biosynthesis polyprenyl glycosylphosphotransferase
MSIDPGLGHSGRVARVDSALPVREPDPLRGFARVLIALDALLLVVAGLVATLSRESMVSLSHAAAVAALVAIAWLITLALIGAYDPHFLGVGATEFSRVVTASVIVLAAAATVGYLTSAESLRSEVLIAIPLGLILVLTERRIARAWLHRRRGRGDFAVRCLVVGTLDQVEVLSHELTSDPSTGLAITEVIEPPAEDMTLWLGQLSERVRQQHIDAVVLAPDAAVSREAVRAIAWRLSGTGTDLMVAPALSDLAGPRAVIRSAPRLPLVHLDEARLTGPQLALKRTGDVAAASIGLLVMLPVLLVVAGIVTITSRGPALFRQQRVGRDGRVFTLTKMRTMVDGAHERHDEILGSPVGRDPRVTALDPRITPVGRFLRRWSLDEFPQLWSVIRGDMSLVGPRPLMPTEMPWLEPFGQRRHLMRPGITGLWQVNGRKELDWSDRIRLDVDYVERWSPALDAVLLLRTIKAVLTGDGAR